MTDAAAAPLGPAALLRRPHVARLLVSALVGRVPSGMVPLALVLFARASGADFHRAGLLSAAYSLGSCVGGPGLSRVMDARGQRRPLVVGGVVSSLALALVPLQPGTRAMVLALVAGAATPPLEPALRTLWPSVLPAGQVPAAFAVDAAAQELIFVVGPLVVLLAQGFGAGGGLVAAAVLGLAGTAWFASSSVSRVWRPPPRAGERHWLGPLRSRRLVVLYVVVVLVGLAVGVPAVALVAYAEQAGATGWAPWLVAANALGALAGGLAYSRRAPLRDPLEDLSRGLAVLAVTYAALATMPSLPLLMGLLSVASGVALPPTLTSVFRLVDRFAPPGTTTEAFAWVISAFLVGSSLGAAAAGLLSDADRTAVAFLVAGAGVLLGLAVSGLLRRGASGPHDG